MRNMIERYEERQIYLLKTGKYIMISGVDPYNRFHASDLDRTIRYYEGEVYDKNNLFRGKKKVVIEDNESNLHITFELGVVRSMTMAQLKSLEAYYIGKPSSGTIEKCLGDDN